MNAVERYLSDLEAALRTGGRRRRRFLAECRDHLADASRAYGPDEAVRRFGPVADAARGFEMEVAVRRARGATVLTAAGVGAVALSTLAMVNAADRGVTAPVAWAVVFFASAQTAGVAMVLALLRAAAMRYEVGTPAEVALLCRRNWVALGFAALTMLAAGAGVPGQTAAWRILLGPAVVVPAAIALASAGRVVRRQASREERAVRAPLAELATLARRTADVPHPPWTARPGVVLVPTLLGSALAAFWWSYLDHGTAPGSAAAAGIEAACVLVGFVVLGPALGLYAPPTRHRERPPA